MKAEIFWPAVNSSQHGVAEGKEFGVDAGEHGLAAVVAVSQGELQQVQQVLWEAGGRQQAKLYNTIGQEIFAFHQETEEISSSPKSSSVL